MRRSKILIPLSVMALIGLLLNPAAAQTVRASVSVESDRLLPEDQAILAELSRQLEDYINHFSWSSENRNILIDCRLKFVFETVSTRASERIYRGQFLINSPSGENILDKAVQFPYQRGQFMDHQRSLFDPLLAIVDYYIYMVMAGELDAYILRGGSLFYEQARSLTDQGLVSDYAIGWRARQEEVNLITDGDHLPLRDAKFYYYEALFYFEEKKDPVRTRENAARVVKLLDQVFRRKPNSTAMKRFMDSHYQEFCELFSYDLNRDNLNAMMRIDNRHSEVYGECQPGGDGKVQ